MLDVAMSPDGVVDGWFNGTCGIAPPTSPTSNVNSQENVRENRHIRRDVPGRTTLGPRTGKTGRNRYGNPCSADRVRAGERPQGVVRNPSLQSASGAPGWGVDVHRRCVRIALASPGANQADDRRRDAGTSADGRYRPIRCWRSSHRSSLRRCRNRKREAAKSINAPMMWQLGD